MAYRTRRTSRARVSTRRAPARRPARTYTARGGRRVSRGARSGAQTVRVVIEQAPANPVARDPMAAARMQVEAAKPQKAKF